ncbi:MAG: hypothetical protein ACOC29_02620, partial [Candidatus Sumerlaeota bacterium]
GQSSLEIFTPDGRETIQKNLHWQGPDRLAATIKLDEPGAYRGAIKVGDKVLRVDPMSMPVSPEFLPREGESGSETLKRVASMSGGKEAIDIRDVLERNLRTTQARPVILPFLLALLLLALLDIAETRFGMLDRLGAWLRRKGIRAPRLVRRLAEAKPRIGKKKPPTIEPQMATTSAERTPRTDIEIEPVAEAEKEKKAAKEKSPEETDSGLGYLKRSKISAQRRFDTKDDEKK